MAVVPEPVSVVILAVPMAIEEPLGLSATLVTGARMSGSNEGLQPDTVHISTDVPPPATSWESPLPKDRLVTDDPR